MVSGTGPNIGTGLLWFALRPVFERSSWNLSLGPMVNGTNFETGKCFRTARTVQTGPSAISGSHPLQADCARKRERGSSIDSVGDPRSGQIKSHRRKSLIHQAQVLVRDP